MLGSGIGGVKAKRTVGVAFLCLAVTAGCWWRSYPERMHTHADLLVAFARKGRDLVATGRFTAESLPELTYPLERAKAFAADARRRSDPPPASLFAFETLLERYRAFVELVDDVRRVRGGDAAGRLDVAVAAVEAAAGEVRAALAREGAA